MTEKYILAIDQSTQGTKGLIFDNKGKLAARADIAHRQIVNEKGWVEHDPEEILKNTIGACRQVIQKAGIDPEQIAAMGISNQRETSVAWNRETGRPVCNAIVWQCARAAELVERHSGESEAVREKTGIPLSPYFPAAKMSWIMENISGAGTLAREGKLCFGTVDSWLLYRITLEKAHKTDYSNASRTQLFDIRKLQWDEEICRSFGIPLEALPEVCMSDTCFGHTTLDGLLPRPIPIHGVLGDSHGALFGQHCVQRGQMKATYGTGSSVMMNIGEKPLFCDKGIATSIAWGMGGRVSYVLEGNLNYTGAVISWMKDELGILSDPEETARMAEEANPEDKTYLVPAFTGLGAPYWDSKAAGLITGMTRTTGRKEIVKAGLECIAYQIADLIELMGTALGEKPEKLKVDGGPTGNNYLMQFQSDISEIKVQIPQLQELSGMGAAYAAGISVGLYGREEIFDEIRYSEYLPHLKKDRREQLRSGWRQAVERALMHE